MPLKPIDCLWLWNDTGNLCPATSMGIDEALLELSEMPVLRTYRWAAPCISIGYFKPFKPAAAQAVQQPVIRRWTGGGVVSHGQDWPFSLVIPRSHPFNRLRPLESYRVIHTALLEALSASRPALTTLLVMSETESTVQSNSCFEKPVTHDLLLAGVKIAGGGQKRTRKGFLHQGSLQLSSDRFPEPMLLAETLSERVEIYHPNPELFFRAQEISRTRYSTIEWTTKF